MESADSMIWAENRSGFSKLYEARHSRNNFLHARRIYFHCQIRRQGCHVQQPCISCETVQRALSLHLITTLVMVALKYVQDIAAGSLDAGKIVASALVHLSLLWSFFPLGHIPQQTLMGAERVFFYVMCCLDDVANGCEDTAQTICMAAAICCMARLRSGRFSIYR
jgi:hypothetical protein